ncbi:MAG TPA: FtsK/SpoIIIE domain-containing protein, partial [Nitriliruptorales bacterium]|nr:FtsK/SpoIIIE domain-containing protein [Nitriliruptorales bacterium]
AQQQIAYAWDPRDGNLLCQGVRGSGTTTALATAAVALAHAHPPHALHLYVVASDGDALTGLAALPHVGAVASAVERERQERLLRHLADELQRRRSALHADAPLTVLLVDDLDGFATVFDPIDDLAVHEQLRRLAAEGPAAGIVVALTAPRLGAVPPGLAAVFSHRLLLRLPDRFDYATVGLHGDDLPPPLPGRAVDTTSLRHMQLALPSPEGLEAAVQAVAQRWGGRRAGGEPVGIGILPTRVRSADLTTAADLDRADWHLPVGIGDRSLTPVGFRLGPGEAALVAGPPRSGKSALLVALARVVTMQRPEVEVAAIALRGSPLGGLADVDRLATDHDHVERMLTALTTGDREVLLLVDDAELVDGPGERLRGILEQRPAHLRIVAAGRSAALRGAYGHWTTVVRRSRHGLALRPQLAADGDLWDVTLPRAPAGGYPVGRGYLVVGGEVELVQAAGG